MRIITHAIGSYSWEDKSARSELQSPDKIRLPGATWALKKVEPLNEAKAMDSSEAGKIPHSQFDQIVHVAFIDIDHDNTS